MRSVEKVTCRPVLRLPGCCRSTRPLMPATSRTARFSRELRSTQSTNSCSNMSAENRLAGSVTGRSEEHTSELQSLMRISYAVFCLKKKTYKRQYDNCPYVTLLIHFTSNR